MAYAAVSLLAIAQRQKKTRSFKRHLGNDQYETHGTDKCDYCNEFAKDVGLLPDKITV